MKSKGKRYLKKLQSFKPAEISGPKSAAPNHIYEGSTSQDLFSAFHFYSLLKPDLKSP